MSALRCVWSALRCGWSACAVCGAHRAVQGGRSSRFLSRHLRNLLKRLVIIMLSGQDPFYSMNAFCACAKWRHIALSAKALGAQHSACTPENGMCFRWAFKNCFTKNGLILTSARHGSRFFLQFWAPAGTTYSTYFNPVNKWLFINPLTNRTLADKWLS